MWEGGGRQDGVEWGVEMGQLFSIINKYILRKERKRNELSFLVVVLTQALGWT